jgi:hypothetical protein
MSGVSTEVCGRSSRDPVPWRTVFDHSMLKQCARSCREVNFTFLLGIVVITRANLSCFFITDKGNATIYAVGYDNSRSNHCSFRLERRKNICINSKSMKLVTLVRLTMSPQPNHESIRPKTITTSFSNRGLSISESDHKCALTCKEEFG